MKGWISVLFFELEWSIVSEAYILGQKLIMLFIIKVVELFFVETLVHHIVLATYIMSLWCCVRYSNPRANPQFKGFRYPHLALLFHNTPHILIEIKWCITYLSIRWPKARHKLPQTNIFLSICYVVTRNHIPRFPSPPSSTTFFFINSIMPFPTKLWHDYVFDVIHLDHTPNTIFIARSTQ